MDICMYNVNVYKTYDIYIYACMLHIHTYIPLCTDTMYVIYIHIYTPVHTIYIYIYIYMDIYIYGCIYIYIYIHTFLSYVIPASIQPNTQQCRTNVFDKQSFAVRVLMV